MALRIWLARFPPPVASKASVADVSVTASLRSRLNDGALESQTWVAPMRSQELRLLGPAHDVDERHVLFETELDQHLTEVRRRSRVDEAAVTFTAHRLDHPERGERIDKGRCSRPGRRPFGQRRGTRMPPLAR